MSCYTQGQWISISVYIDIGRLNFELLDFAVPNRFLRSYKRRKRKGNSSLFSLTLNHNCVSEVWAASRVPGEISYAASLHTLMGAAQEEMHTYFQNVSIVQIISRTPLWILPWESAAHWKWVNLITWCNFGFVWWFRRRKVILNPVCETLDLAWPMSLEKLVLCQNTGGCLCGSGGSTATRVPGIPEESTS